ncbi:MAG: hypothetical protein KAS04_01210 [Candidatus Aenigmarchaeota archaeon]|nr:hypothetical protein [Candidatus Aenigmarchaeota archaeon]
MIEKIKCHCKNVDFGTYENTVSMKEPYTGEWICIDTCLATLIGYLWHNGIETINSCCGHGKLQATVIVTNDSVEKMKKLGYKNTELECILPKQTFDV